MWETHLLLRGLGPAPLDDARTLFGVVILCLAVAGAAAEPVLAWRLTAAWVLPLWLMFAWYVPIAASERFLVPVLAPLLLLAGAGAARIIAAAAGDERRGARLALAGGLLWSAGWTIAAAVVA
jgi:hypothetical protein